MRKTALVLLFIFTYASVTKGVDNNFSGIENPENNTSGYDVKFYFLDLSVNNTSIDIKGSATIMVQLTQPATDSLVFDMGNGLAIDSVNVDNTKAQYLHSNNRLVIRNIIDTQEPLSVQVFYKSRNISGKTEGLYNAADREWGNRVTWTLSEPFSSRNWFPCKQDLNDKADSVYVFITTDKNNRAGSNGLLTSETEMPGNLVRYEWKSRHPVAYYLISFTVSNYRDYSFYSRLSNGDSILVQNYIYDTPQFFTSNKNDIDRTSDMLNLFSDLFGPYPFKDEKYGHCIVPSGGGMEHQTMTTLDNFSFLLVSHELAHQWFGNYVTCGSWQDIWLNEGFSSYAEYLACQYLRTQSEADRWMAEAQKLSMSSAGSVYIPATNVNNERRIFDYRLTYKKGAAIVHMIRHEIGNDSLFFSILQEYLNKFSNGNALGIDMCSLLNERSGKDFTDFFNQWYFGEGHPVFSISWEHNNGVLKITSGETTTASTPLFNSLLDFRVNVDGRDTIISRRQLSEFETWEINLQGKVTAVEADPYRWLLAEIQDAGNENMRVLSREED